jgi:hypothetical protein
MEEYILHRLHIAGNRDAVQLTEDALNAIFKYSRGIPRLVNIICDFLMLSAFAEERSDIDEDMVIDIIGDLDFENQYWSSANPEIRQEDGIVPLKAEIIESESEIAHLLREITSRLDTIEKESLEFRKMINQELDEKLSKFVHAMQSHADETGAKVIELRRKIDEVIEENKVLHILEDTEHNKNGLLKRIFK